MIKLEKLPTNLVEHSIEGFNKMYALHPEQLGKVLVYNKKLELHEEKQIYRHYMSYLESPLFDKGIPKSYMFSSAKDEFRMKDIPVIFMPFVDFAKSINPLYNQVTINWYDNDHYIEMHRDCTAKFININSPILTININESDDLLKCRSFILQDVETKEVKSYLLTNNSYLIIDSECQKSYRHGVGPGAEKRISITFRMIGVSI